ncbi:MAG: NAD(P)H-dependent oxidoreductase [Endomicrobiales bacterium]|nr:NAD(P)H-dependent oxidoreductase [Endomicrobiales bacterium]
MQVLILYYSRTGTTEKLAREIAKGVNEVKDVKCIIKNTSEVTKDDFTSSNAIIAGSPVYFGTMAAQLKEVFDKHVGLRRQMEGKLGAAFATSGDSSGGKETTMFSIIQAMMIYGMIVVGDPMNATGHYGVASTGAPDSQASSNAAKLGKRVADLAKKLNS